MRRRSNFWLTGILPVPVRIAATNAAYGDQCEKCGTSLNATDLINPKS